jgi:acetyltransferase-like isoleucine patch superfamily enzyme
MSKSVMTNEQRGRRDVGGWSARRRMNAKMWTLREELAAWDPRLSTALAVFRLLPPLVGARVRHLLLRFAGVQVGERTVFGGRIRVGGGRSPSSRLAIGADCFINDGCRFDTTGQIVIADDVYLAHDVALITSSHEIGPPARRAQRAIAAPVAIGRGTWIGARAIVLPGVAIGSGVIVAAGAVVTRDVEDNVMVAGVPARVIRHLDALGAEVSTARPARRAAVP